MAKRYQPQALIGEQGGVQTFAGRDALNGLPVRMYTFMGEPTARVGELGSPYIPPVLSSTFLGGAGEVIVAFSPEFRPLKGTVAPGQVEALLRQSAAALDDAARAGVVHGDLSPERVLFDREAGQGGRFLLEGYGVPWRVKPSEFSAPERIGGASFASDIFSWARTVTHLSGPLPGDLRDLLARCLDADPAARPHAREVRAALDSYPFGARVPQPGPSVQAARDVSAFDDYSRDEDDALEDPLNDFRADDFDAGDFVGNDLTRDDYAKDDLDRNDSGAGDATDPALRPGASSRPGWSVRVQPAPPSTSSPGSSTAPDTAPNTAPNTAARPLEPSPPHQAGAVWIVPRTAEAPDLPHELPSDSLRQIDQTAAYRARRARYDAEHSLAVSPSGNAPPPPTPARPEAVRLGPTPGKRNDDQGDEDFEVVDDIDDRAPDPTLNRGGRRVLLLTLLVIAFLVLLALQFV